MKEEIGRQVLSNDAKTNTEIEKTDKVVRQPLTNEAHKADLKQQKIDTKMQNCLHILKEKPQMNLQKNMNCASQIKIRKFRIQISNL